MTLEDGTLQALGEFSLIDRIVERLGEAAARDILVPPGDDAAVWAGAAATVATIDALVEGTHWRRDTMAPADVGWRAVTANVSDLAAMGAEPGYLLVASVLAPSMTLEQLDAFVDGLAAAALHHGVRVAGGDVVRGAETAFTIAAYGTAEVDGDGAAIVMRRGAARPGDAVAVSGMPGSSAAGLRLIEEGREGEPGAKLLIEQAHRRPVARVDLGRAALAAGVRCAIDVSDGLLQDAGHIAERSRAGLEIELEALPVSPFAVELFGLEATRDLALGGGEDFELVLVGEQATLRALGEQHPLTLIGRVTEDHAGEAWALDASGARYTPPSAGWDQLAVNDRRAER